MNDSGHTWPIHYENLEESASKALISFMIRSYYWFVLQKVTNMAAKLPDVYPIYINGLQDFVDQ
jgi:hypothetical protein